MNRDLMAEDSARSARVAAAGGPMVPATSKSLAVTAAAWMRGDDLLDGPAVNRLVAPYNQSGWVFAAVNLVSGEFTGLPMKFYLGDQEFMDTAFAAWWANPAVGPDRKLISRARVDQLLAMWMQLEGEYFLLLDDTWAVAGLRRNVKALSPFIIARPDKIRLIIQGGVLMGYEWIDAGGGRHVCLPEQVVHKMEPNPYDDWRGLGRQVIARVPTEGAFLTGTYIRDLMRNNGDQGYIVIGKSGIATDPQREQIVAALRAKRLALQRGVAKDIFLTGDITVDRKEEQAASADLTNTKNLSHQEIFITFGVPPSMATVKNAYSIGKDSDRYQLITGTSQPLSRTICGTYAELGSRQTGRDLVAEHDWDDHPVMVEVRNARIDAAIKLWGTGWPWQTINDYLDLGMQPFPGWEIPYLPFSVAPVDAGAKPAVSPSADPALAEPKAIASREVAQLHLLVLARTRSRVCRNVTPPAGDPFAMFTCECHGAAGIAQKSDRPEREIAQWRSLMAQRRGTIKAFQSAMGRVLMAARVETLKNIEAFAGLDKSVVKAGAAAHLLFDLARFAVNFQRAMEGQQKEGLKTAGQQLFVELKNDDVFSYPPEEVLKFIEARKNKLKDVPQEVFDRLKASLEEGVHAGETSLQLAGRAKGIFNDITDGHARTIALTESGAVYGGGRHEAMKQAGVQWKTWLTSGNSNVRASHADANGQTVAIEEPFVVDGEELMYPGDDAGSAGNVINCHCIPIASATGPAE